MTEKTAEKMAEATAPRMDPDRLPDGKTFDFWDDHTVYSRTYYIDNRNENASDDNDGSEESPFRTINRAAAVAGPGERILIREGIYRETIRDVRGGTGPDHMVMLEGRGNVIITGAVDWKPDFCPSEGLRQTAPVVELDLFSPDDRTYYANNGARVFMGEIPAGVFSDGYNPFSILNLAPISFGGSEKSVPLLLKENAAKVFDPDAQLEKRGLLFCDGKRMEQVVRPHELWQKDGTFWIEEGGRILHLRLERDEAPGDHVFEITVREQGFAPAQSGLSYIRLWNLTFEKFANPFIPPQRGAVSTNCGHHFIVEDCTFRDINSVGMDMGFISHYHLHDGIRGYHIVRNCRFIRCGICGVCALPTQGAHLKGMLIENNLFDGNCWHNTEPIWECAAIKNHYTEDCLYRYNIVTDTLYGAGIWLDKNCRNTRVCCNLFAGIRHSLYGAVLIEATYFPIRVDYNFICDTGHRVTPLDVKTGGHGIFLNETDEVLLCRNIILNTVGDGIHSHYVETPRVVGTYHPRATTGSQNRVLGNLIHRCRRAVTFMNADNDSDGNMIGDVDDAVFYFEDRKEKYSLEESREKFGFERHGFAAAVRTKFDRQTLRAEITVDGHGHREVLDLNKPDEIRLFMDRLAEPVRRQDILRGG